MNIISSSFLLLLGSLTLLSRSARAQVDLRDYVECFESIKPQFHWPIKMITNKCRASNNFGPIMSKCLKAGEYAFTRSMSFKGRMIGEEVYAVMDGKVVHVGKFFHDGDSLHAVVIEHELGAGCEYEDQPVSKFYTIYGHLLSGAGLPKPDVDQYVSGGEIIGLMGKCTSGCGAGASLLYQVRLGVKFCTDIDRDCVTFGSPVHPYLTRPMINNTFAYELERTDEVNGGNLTVAVSTPCNETDIVQYYVECGTQTEANLDISKVHTLNVNTREGFGPIPMLYMKNDTVPFLEPSRRPWSPRRYRRWTINFHIPSSWFPLTDDSQCCYVEVEDMWGNMIAEEYCGPSTTMPMRE